jgi:hypothetical protein
MEKVDLNQRTDFAALRDSGIGTERPFSVRRRSSATGGRTDFHTGHRQCVLMAQGGRASSEGIKIAWRWGRLKMSAEHLRARREGRDEIVAVDGQHGCQHPKDSALVRSWGE